MEVQLSCCTAVHGFLATGFASRNTTHYKHAAVRCALLLQVFPKCGDGVKFAVTLTPIDGSEVQTLHEVGPT